MLPCFAEGSKLGSEPQQPFKRWTERKRRSSGCTPAPQLNEIIKVCAELWISERQPFDSHKQADEIITKVKRSRAMLNQIKSLDEPAGQLVQAVASKSFAFSRECLGQLTSGMGTDTEGPSISGAPIVHQLKAM